MISSLGRIYIYLQIFRGALEMNEDRPCVSLTVITGTGRKFFGATGR